MTSNTNILASKIRIGRAVLWFYTITFLSVEIIRHMTNQ